MSGIADIGAAVIGTGFIGTVHVEALRRIGVQVRGVLGSTPGAWRGACLGARRPARLSVARGAARRPGGRCRARHVAQRPPSPADDGDPRRPPSRHLREAARDVGRRVARDGPAGRGHRARQRSELQHPLLPAQPARPRAGRRWRGRRRAPRDRPLLPGLAAPRERLELASPARARRLAAGRRRHRLALARSDRPSSPAAGSWR